MYFIKNFNPEIIIRRRGYQLHSFCAFFPLLLKSDDLGSNYLTVAKLREQNQRKQRNDRRGLIWIIRGWLAQLKASGRMQTNWERILISFETRTKKKFEGYYSYCAYYFIRETTTEGINVYLTRWPEMGLFQESIINFHVREIKLSILCPQRPCMPTYIYVFNTFVRFNKSLSRIIQSNLVHIFTCCEVEYFSEKRLLREVSDWKTDISSIKKILGRQKISEIIILMIDSTAS